MFDVGHSSDYSRAAGRVTSLWRPTGFHEGRPRVPRRRVHRRHDRDVRVRLRRDLRGYMCIYIYIYRERERDQKNNKCAYIYVYICLYVCMYIYIYIYTHTYIHIGLRRAAGGRARRARRGRLYHLYDMYVVYFVQLFLYAVYFA